MTSDTMANLVRVTQGVVVLSVVWTLVVVGVARWRSR